MKVNNIGKLLNIQDKSTLERKNKRKFEELKGAIEKGFNEAKRILGGTLPEISQKTYDSVMDKLSAWENE